MGKIEFHIDDEISGKRIDVQAAEMSGITRSQVQHLIEEGLISVNDHQVKDNYRTKPGDVISLTLPEAESEQKLIPEDIPIKIYYQDEHVIVVDKPPQMVVYPSTGHNSGTLMNAIAFHSARLASIGGPLRAGVVHRLDKDTSGVMIVALEDKSYYALFEQFKERTIYRKYITMIYGTLKNSSGEISLKIGRSETDRKKMSTQVKRGKEAVTRWTVIERYKGATLIEARLATGRTHQIRVHFASIGHPVLGDSTYGKKLSMEIGGKKISFQRQMLHAESLGFIHPATGQYLEFNSPIPDDMREKINEMRNA